MSDKIDESLREHFQDIPIGSLVWDVARRLSALEIAYFEQRPTDSPLSTLMWHVAYAPGQGMTFYARRMSIDQATFGRYVNTLVDAGHIHKETDAEDNRVRVLRLTEAGYGFLQMQRETYRNFEKMMRMTLGAAKHDRLSVLLVHFLRSTDAILPAQPDR